MQADDIGQVRRLLELERAVAAIAVRFITLRCDAIDAAIGETLERIGVLAGADRSYVLRLRADNRTVDNTHEWCAAGVSAQRGSLQGLDLDGDFPWFARGIRQFSTLRTATADLPTDAHAERAALEAQGIVSIVVAPLVDDGVLAGCIGFDAVRGGREWSAEDATLLGTIGEILVKTWARQRTESALRHAEDRWRALTENSGTIILSVDPQLRIRSMNRVVSGFQIENVIGTPVLDYHLPHEKARVEAIYRRVFASGAPEVIQIEALGADGTHAWYESRLVPMKQDGQVVEVLVQGTDITERVRSQEALRRNEARFRNAFEASPLGVGIARGGIVVYANTAYVRIFGYDAPEQIIGTSMIGQIAPEQRSWIIDRVRRREAGETVEDSYDVRGVRRDGATFPFHVNVARIDLEDGPATIAFIADTTEKMAAEQALHESEARFQAFMDHSPFIAFLKDHDGRFVYANRRYLDQFGIALSDLRGKSLFDLFPAAVAQRLAEKDRQVLDSDRTHESIEVVPAYDGTKPTSWLVIKFPVRDAAGRRYVGAVAIDRTVEQGLEQARRRLATIIEATTDLVGTADADGRTLFLNRSGRAMVGLAADADLTSVSVRDYHPAWAADLVERIGFPAAIREGSWSGETALKHRDGHEIPVLQALVAHRDDRGEVEFLSTIIRDISLRKRDEQALRESEARLQAVFENLPFEFWACDDSGRYVLQNSASITAWGRRVGQYAADVDGPDVERRQLAADNARVLGGQTISVEIDRVEQGRRRWCHQLMAPIRSDGRIVGLIGVQIDITERKHLEDQLRQAQKMEAVGKLAGGIAHDFNNLLTAIMGFSGILLERHRPGDPSHRAIEQIMKSSERAAALTSKLLAFSRKQVVQPRVIDLTAVIRELGGLLRRLIGEDVVLDLDLRAELWPVRADAAQVEQVLMNLVVNARDAMPNGGRLGIRTANVSAQSVPDGVPRADHVSFSVSDTGRGIAKDVLPHIFEPFFTTKRPGEGTGLGLSTVYGIAQQSGGVVCVTPGEDSGSLFTVFLPRVSGTAADPSGPHPILRQRGKESLLVVEDEPQLRDLIAEMLRSAGYTVVAAASGEEAIARHAPPADFALIVTDVIMPVMSGRELVERLSRQGSKARALFISGYTDNIISAYGSLEPGTAFLQKPFTAEILLRKVREVLDGGAA